MGYLLDNCLFDRLSTAIINQCQPYKCSKDSDIDSFFHDGAKDNYAFFFDGFGHHHVGDEMMDLIKTLAINPENTIAARYLVVDAVNTPKVISFYERNGFKFLFASDQEEQECLHNIPQESIWCKIKRAVVGSNEPISKSRTRLMYFDLIVLNQINV